MDSNNFLIVGLGNPGTEYELTRHNVGFLVCDKLCKEATSEFKSGRFGWITSFRLKNKIVHVQKPDTFMNLSGKAVKHWLNELKIPISNLLVVTDDLALPLGKIRLRAKGSDAGHNGLKSINEILGTEQFARLRFGIGNDFPKGRQVDFVLGTWSKDEYKIVEQEMERALMVIKAFVLEGPAAAMTRYNQ